MGAFAAILRKDLRLELRGGGSTITMVTLAILILVVLVMAFDLAGRRAEELAAGALWIAMILAGVAGATRAMLAESASGCMDAMLLSPADRAIIFAAKMAAALIFILVAEAAVIVALVLFFNLDFDARLIRLTPVLIMGAIGFAAVATLLAPISSRTRAGDLVLPLLVTPVFVPALIGAVKASAAMLAGRPWHEAAMWLRVLGAFDVLFVVAGYLLFDYVVGE
jgi:heme exporter protein B